VLFQNPLYATGRLASPPCPAPELDVHDADSMEHFLHTLTDCLDQAWTVQFAKAGLDFEPPERVFWRKPGSSPCRDYPSAAGGFYCRANKSIYLGVRDIAAKWKYSPESVVYASLLAHEYGHHVQGEAGILEYYHEQRRQESDPAQQSFWTRRSELQANCLAGVFLGSVQVTYPIGDSEYETLLEDAANTADREGSSAAERTHGSAHNSALWLERGLSHQTPGSCNTWTADESLLE
jgi:predicted metalloprotease